MTQNIIDELYDILKMGISPHLSYHGLHHTIDVHNICKWYIHKYHLESHQAHLLEIAAVGHDTGFLRTYRQHEEVSASIVSEKMFHYGFSQADIQCVTGMIMATKIPQKPTNLLEEIICDAD